MSSKGEKDKSPTDTASVIDVEPMWSLGESLNGQLIEVTNVKCSTCKVPTQHEWLSIQPKPLFQTDDMLGIVAKRKRLTLCTVCGTLRLIT